MQLKNMKHPRLTKVNPKNKLDVHLTEGAQEWLWEQMQYLGDDFENDIEDVFMNEASCELGENIIRFALSPESLTAGAREKQFWATDAGQELLG